MEGGHGHLLRVRADQGLQAFGHLLGGPAGEGDRQALAGGDIALQHQVRQPVGDGAGLAGARAGHDQQRPARDFGRRALVGIQTAQHAWPGIWEGGRSRFGFRQRRGDGCGHGFWLRLRGEQRVVEQCGRIAGAQPGELGRVENADGAVFTVVAGIAQHVAVPQPLDRLGHRGVAAPQLVDRHVLEDRQLRAVGGGEVADLAEDLLALGPHTEDLAHDLRQRDQVVEVGRTVGADARGPVGERFDAVQHADGQGLAAAGAQSTVGAGVARFEAHLALAVSVEVVFAFLGEELHGAGETLAGLQRPFDREVVQVGVEDAGLPAQHRRRMRIGVADQRVSVEPGDPPVHLRVAGEPGLQREDVPGQIPVAVFHRVEPGLGAQHREPRGPDVRGHQVGAVAGFQGDLQQVPGVQAQDRAAVGAEVADAAQPPVELLGGGEIRHVAEVVDLAGALAVLVDGGDLHGQHEPHLPAAGGRQAAGEVSVEVATQPEQAGLGGFEHLAQVLEPGGVGEIAGPDQRDALAARPPGQVLDVAVFAARAGILRVDVQIGVEAHPAILPKDHRPPCPGGRAAAIGSVSGCVVSVPELVSYSPVFAGSAW